VDTIRRKLNRGKAGNLIYQLDTSYITCPVGKKQETLEFDVLNNQMIIRFSRN